MAITNDTVIAKVIASQLLLAFRQAIVFSGRTNNAYRSLLNAGGNEITINRPGDASVSDYAAKGTVTYADADVGAPVKLTLNKTKAWSVKFDDIQASLSNTDVLAAAVREHGVALAEQVDKDVRAGMVADATAGPALTADHNAANLSIDSFSLSAMHRLMDLQNIPRAGRFMIVGPYSAELIQRIALKDSVLLTQGGSLANGSIGSFAGFTFYVAPGGFTDYKASTKKATETLLYGVDSATAFIDTIRRTERLRLESTFADAVRGLYSYGYKVIEPTHLYKSEMVISNVPA